MPRALYRAAKHVEDNLGHKLTLESLAAAACMSRFHFARLFRLATGESPMAYIARARIERAQALLTSGEHRTAEIAAALGFCDQSHFTRVFRRLTGVTPRAYARSAQRGAELRGAHHGFAVGGVTRFAPPFAAGAAAANDPAIEEVVPFAAGTRAAPHSQIMAAS